MATIYDCVRSLIPGRVRLRHPALYRISAENAGQIEGLIGFIEGVTGVTVNPRVASLLITWDEEKISGEELLTTIESYAAAFAEQNGESEAVQPGSEAEPVSGGQSDAAAAVCPVRRAVRAAAVTVASAAISAEEAADRAVARVTRFALPKTAKRSPKKAERLLISRLMSGALAVSMVSLFVGGSGLHVVTGMLFLGILSLHMARNRASL